MFAYGSLLWDPCFPFEVRATAHLEGWCRSFCVSSTNLRGSTRKPGLVLGLERSQASTCVGEAFFVPPDCEQVALEALRDRELRSNAYCEIWVKLSNPSVLALTYVANVKHSKFTKLDNLSIAKRICLASGSKGSNLVYLTETVNRLRKLEIRDSELEALISICSAQSGKSQTC